MHESGKTVNAVQIVLFPTPGCRGDSTFAPRDAGQEAAGTRENHGARCRSICAVPPSATCAGPFRILGQQPGVTWRTQGLCSPQAQNEGVLSLPGCGQ